jgi:signal transduction histidine kinase
VREADAHAAEARLARLEALVDLGCTMPVDAGPEALAEAFVDGLARILPEHAIGLCLARPTERGGQRTFERVPAGLDAHGHDATRLFPGLGGEIVAPIASDPTGSTLHAASLDPADVAESTGLPGFLDRAARVIASLLRSTRSVQLARRSSTEITGLQAQVIQAEKLAHVGQIAAGVVHELNNPLTSILAYADALRSKAEREQADPIDVERLRRIGEAAERILRFARDLVTYARPTTGAPALVDLGAAIEQALVFCEHDLASAGVSVECDIPVDLDPLRGVRAQLTQVFVNLFTNACHAMDGGGGRLTVRASSSGGRVRIWVADDGHGIDPAHLPRIFDPFFTTKPDGTGSGLGLSIVREIVARHGGTVHAESAHERGTTFVLELPSAARVEPGLAAGP